MNKKHTVSIAVPPPVPMGGITCWERSEDPWHPEAFEGIFGKTKGWFASVKERIIFLGSPNDKLSEGQRKSGWMAIDGVGNAIGFYPDGYKIEHYEYEYILAESYPGRLCAVQNNDSSIEHFRNMNNYLGYNEDGSKRK
jgi:hypothetical protein